MFSPQLRLRSSEISTIDVIWHKQTDFFKPKFPLILGNFTYSVVILPEVNTFTYKMSVTFCTRSVYRKQIRSRSESRGGAQRSATIPCHKRDPINTIISDVQGRIGSWLDFILDLNYSVDILPFFQMNYLIVALFLLGVAECGTYEMRPGGKPKRHGPFAPPFLRNMTWDAKKEYYSILRNRNETIAAQKQQIMAWARNHSVEVSVISTRFTT